MPRFRKGTTDHDNDGRMGGSMKEDAMVKVKAVKKVAKAKRVAKVKVSQDPAVEFIAEPKAPTRREDLPEAKATPAEQQSAAADQFAKADAAAIAHPDDPGEFRLRMAALGGL